MHVKTELKYTYDGRPLPTTGVGCQYIMSMLNSYKQKHAALKRDLDSGGDGIKGMQYTE